MIDAQQVMKLPRTLYLVKRGPKPGHHRAPFHPVIVCTQRWTAMWEAGSSGDRSWVWTRGPADDGEGWLLVRWEGLDIDYGHVVRSFALPDGTGTAFAHPGNPAPGHRAVWDLLAGAVWWSADHRLPDWLAARGVVLPPDDHTRRVIEDDAGTCTLPEREQDRIRDRRMGAHASAPSPVEDAGHA